MTISSKAKIRCRCKADVEFILHETVNITADPELKQEVMDRKINHFKCDQCGYEQELIANFLYHDMDNSILAWVLPESLKNDKEALEYMQKTIDKAFQGLGRQLEHELQDRKQFTVFGYNELIELLKSVEDSNANQGEQKNG